MLRGRNVDVLPLGVWYRLALGLLMVAWAANGRQLTTTSGMTEDKYAAAYSGAAIILVLG